MSPLPKLQEKYTFKIPAITLLNNLGWQYLSPKQALALRGGMLGNVVLETVLRAELAKRTFEFAGQERALMQGLL